jgi:transposase-like protein
MLISELQIMLKECYVIKNPRIGIETLGLKCIFCGNIDIKRNGIKNNKQRMECNICHKSWGIPQLNIGKYRLSKRNKKLVVPTVQNEFYDLSSVKSVTCA